MLFFASNGQFPWRTCAQEQPLFSYIRACPKVKKKSFVIMSKKTKKVTCSSLFFKSSIYYMQWHREGFLMRVFLLFYISGVILKGLHGLLEYTAQDSRTLHNYEYAVTNLGITSSGCARLP